MKLSQLEATFLKIIDEKTYQIGASFDEAQGIQFLCPKCYNDPPAGPIGCHMVLCWFKGRGVPESLDPGPGRWNPSGTGIDDLTFAPPGAVSVLLKGGCNWHGFVRNGDAA